MLGGASEAERRLFCGLWPPPATCGAIGWGLVFQCAGGCLDDAFRVRTAELAKRGGDCSRVYDLHLPHVGARLVFGFLEGRRAMGCV